MSVAWPHSRVCNLMQQHLSYVVCRGVRAVQEVARQLYQPGAAAAESAHAGQGFASVPAEPPCAVLQAVLTHEVPGQLVDL